jgi:hypothetical protein
MIPGGLSRRRSAPKKARQIDALGLAPYRRLAAFSHC